MTGRLLLLALSMVALALATEAQQQAAHFPTMARPAYRRLVSAVIAPSRHLQKRQIKWHDEIIDSDDWAHTQKVTATLPTEQPTTAHPTCSGECTPVSQQPTRPTRPTHRTWPTWPTRTWPTRTWPTTTRRSTTRPPITWPSTTRTHPTTRTTRPTWPPSTQPTHPTHPTYPTWPPSPRPPHPPRPCDRHPPWAMWPWPFPWFRKFAKGSSSSSKTSESAESWEDVSWPAWSNEFSWESGDKSGEGCGPTTTTTCEPTTTTCEPTTTTCEPTTTTCEPTTTTCEPTTTTCEPTTEPTTTCETTTTRCERKRRHRRRKERYYGKDDSQLNLFDFGSSEDEDDWPEVELFSADDFDDHKSAKRHRKSGRRSSEELSIGAAWI